MQSNSSWGPGSSGRHHEGYKVKNRPHKVVLNSVQMFRALSNCNGIRRFRSLLRYHDGRLQVPERKGSRRFGSQESVPPRAFSLRTFHPLVSFFFETKGFKFLKRCFVQRVAPKDSSPKEFPKEDTVASMQEGQPSTSRVRTGSGHVLSPISHARAVDLTITGPSSSSPASVPRGIDRRSTVCSPTDQAPPQSVTAAKAARGRAAAAAATEAPATARWPNVSLISKRPRPFRLGGLFLFSPAHSSPTPPSPSRADL